MRSSTLVRQRRDDLWWRLLGRMSVPMMLMLVAALAIAVIVVAGALTTPGFMHPVNLLSIVRAAAIVGIMALGLTFVTISGNFFLLSVTEIAALSSIVFSFAVNAHLAPLEVVLIVLAVSAGLGALQGVLIGLGGNAIVVTLAFGGVIFGCAAFISNAEQILIVRPNSFEWIGSGLSFGVPNATWLFIALTLAAQVVLTSTTFGRRLFLNGDNLAAARAVGNRDLVIAIAVCAIAGAAGGVVGSLFSAQMSAGYINHFTGAMGASGSLTLNAIAAVMVGGTAISGGSGSAIRSATGAIFIALVDNLMVLRGFTTGPRILFVGLIILLSVGLYNVLKADRG